MPALLQTLLHFFFSPKGRISRGAFSAWFWLGSLLYLGMLTPILLALGILLIPELIKAFFCILLTLLLIPQSGCLHFEAFTEVYKGMAAYLWASAAITLLLLPSFVFVPLKRLRDAGLSPLLLMLWFLPPANLLLALGLSFYPPSKETGVP